MPAMASQEPLLLPDRDLKAPTPVPELKFRGKPVPKWVVMTMKLASLPALLSLVAMAVSQSPWASSSWVLSLSAGSPGEAVDTLVAPESSATRWLWWPMILYLFWGMAYTCDEYFVRTIDVISERFSIPDDVAGATLMALGCNGPELALNAIAIFHPSDIGIGAVMGGEVFNVLVIIGTALLATPASYMPLKLGCFTFGRDVFFYAVSVALLYWVLRDGLVTRQESAVLLVGALTYIFTVVMSDRLRSFLVRVTSRAKRGSIRKSMRGSMRRGVSSFIRMNTPQIWETSSPKGEDEESDSSEESDEDPEMTELWQQGSTCADPNRGSVLGVRTNMHNRLMDRTHHYESRYLCLGGESLLLSTAQDPRRDQASKCTSTVAYEAGAPNQPVHGGLVNQPVHLEAKAGAQNSLLEQPSAEFLQHPSIKDMAVEVIPLENILYVERLRDSKHFNLHVQHSNSELGGVVNLAFRGEEAVMDAWYSALMVKLIDLRRTNTGPPPSRSLLSMAREWAEWLQFPVKFCLSVTIPDMERPELAHLYPVAFTMSMVWLAIFAFTVITACDGIHRDFGISNQVLGFTVAAAGTSLPNVFSGMCVARQGKTSMAVANALGANVQNVFLALAIPWAIQSWVVNKGPFAMEVNNIVLPILWCYMTLLPVVAIFVLNNFSMPRWSGGLFLVMYLVYLVFALGEQLSSCPKWPLQC